MSENRWRSSHSSTDTATNQVPVASSLDETRRSLVQQTAAMLIVAGVIAIVVADRMTTLPAPALIAAIAGLSVCAAAIALARSHLPIAIAAGCLIGSWLLALLSVAYLRGGLDAPLLIAVPIVPVIAATVLSRATTWIVLLAILIALAVLYGLELVGHEFPQSSSANQNFDLMRALWIALSSVMATKLATYNMERNENLALALQRLALTDELTGVANRRAIKASLDRELARTKRDNTSLCVLMLDIDRFKHLNDMRGHLAGDEALVRIASAISDQLRAGGDAIGRWGGEEFLIVLCNSRIEEALKAAQRVAQCVTDLGIPYDQAGAEVATVTIGAAQHNASASAEDLVHSADQAMYRGKTQGRNQIVAAEVTP